MCLYTVGNIFLEFVTLLTYKRNTAMAREKLREQQPEITIDDVQPVQDGFVHAYTGTATLHGVRAVAYLDIVEREHWPAGHYLPHAYELTFSYERLAKKGSMDPHCEADTGDRLIAHLRERMLTQMREAGWRRVGQTRQGRDIWQHRPSLSSPAPSISSGREQPEMEAVLSRVPGEPEQAKREEGRLSKDPSDQGDATRVQQQTRIYTSRAITFTCVQCGRTVTEQRFPSHRPLYCSNPTCKREATRKKTRERVANYRRRHPDARKKQRA
jgi:hypothetical protein